MSELKVAIATDDSSGIMPDRGKEMGITVISVPFFIDGKLYRQAIDITQDEFFQRMESNPDMRFSTSMPAPGTLIQVWEDLLKEHDEVLYIPMTAGLSKSTETALALSKEFEGRVQVVDNHRISLTQYQSVLDAITLRDAGKNAKEIKEILEEQKYDSSIYIMVDSLDYLKKGGRVTPAAALLGGLLKIKPVLQIQGEKLDSFAKARGLKSAKKIMIKTLKDELENRFSEYEKKGEMRVFISYTYANEEFINKWLEEVKEAFPDHDVIGDPLSLCISCHTGPGCIGIGCARVVKP